MNFHSYSETLNDRILECCQHSKPFKGSFCLHSFYFLFSPRELQINTKNTNKLMLPRGNSIDVLVCFCILFIHCTVDSYLQGPKQVKDRGEMAWPLIHKNQKITNNIPFLKLFFSKGSDLPQGQFFFLWFFGSRVLQKN